MSQPPGQNRRALLRSAAVIGIGAATMRADAFARQATPEAGDHRIGPPGWFLSLLTLQDPYPGQIQAPAQPPPGTRYVAAELQIDNDSDQPLNFTPTDVRMRDADGVEYRGGTAIGQEPMLNARNLNGGERSRGWVWFTVAVNAQLVELVYVAPPPVYRMALAEA